MAALTEEWSTREAALLAKLQKREGWANSHAKWNRQFHRVASIIVLTCSVLAPVLVISGGPVDQMPLPPPGAKPGEALTSFLGLTPTESTRLAIAITLILAFVEGLRRLFHFEQRWAAGNSLRQGLYDARELYLDSQVGKEIGSDEWVKNYSELRKRYMDLESVDAGRFFEAILSSQSGPQGSVR